MHRRTFLVSSGAVGIGALFATPGFGQAAATTATERLSWNAGELGFEFSVSGGRLTGRSSQTLPRNLVSRHCLCKPPSPLWWSPLSH